VPIDPIHLYIVLAAGAGPKNYWIPSTYTKSLEFVFSNTLCVITGLLYINDVDDDDQLKQHL